MKLRPVSDKDGKLVGWAFYCPGCDSCHVFYVSGLLVWGFDGDKQLPTFTPSLLNTCENHPDPKLRRCHLNLTAGKIMYHGDSTHDFAGKTVDLKDH